MSRYTIQLKDIISLYGYDEVISWFNSYDIGAFLTQQEIAVINERGTWKPERLAEKIINHYLIYEIGYETPSLFKHMVKNEMNELMEEYLPLIYSASIEYDPLVNVNFTETFHQEEQGNQNNSGKSASSTNSDTTGLQINSDTPQGKINKDDILKGDYASSTSASEGTAMTTDNTSTSSNTDTTAQSDYTKTTKGNSGVSATAQKMIEQYNREVKCSFYGNLLKERK